MTKICRVRIELSGVDSWR